jgi:hypothetical protein
MPVMPATLPPVSAYVVWGLVGVALPLVEYLKGSVHMCCALNKFTGWHHLKCARSTWEDIYQFLEEMKSWQPLFSIDFCTMRR